MNYIKLILFTLLFLLISSCRKVIEPKDLPQQDPRLVLNCILSPDSEVTAQVSLSRSILSNKDYKYVNNAVCDLYENDAFLETLKSAGDGSYTGSATIRANKNYTVKTSAPGYDGVIGSTFIPGSITTTPAERYDTINSDYKISSYSTGPSTYVTYINGSLKFRFSINDDPAAKNYYSIKPVVIFYDTAGVSKTIVNAGISANATELNSQNSSYGNSLEYDDQSLTNGNGVKADLSVSISETLQPDFKLKTVEVYLVLYNLSPEYYKYLVTLNNQAYAGTSIFSEPVQVYSNMSNGMGIVAGSNLRMIRVYAHNP